MRKLLFLLTFSFLISPLAYAEMPNALTWQDCVVMAARNNPDLLSALQALAASHAEYLGSFNGIFPHLTVSNSYADTSSSRAGVLSNGFSGTVTNESKLWQLEGTASLNLFDMGQWASIQNASAVLHQNQANVAVSASNVLLNLYKAFTGLLYAQDEGPVYTDIQNTWKTNAQMIALRYDSGSESKGNKMNTQAQLMQSEANLAQTGRDLEVAQQQLGQVLGINEFTALVVTGTWSASPVPMPHPDFDAIVEKNPQFQAQEAMLEQARIAIKTAHSTLWPTLSLNYSKGVEGTAELPTDPFWTFTGVLSYPLFGNGLTSTYYASQAAQRSYVKAQQDLRSLRNQLHSNLVTAWSAFAQAQDQLHVQDAFLEAARQRKGESDINYQSGLMPYAEWVIIIQDYVNFQVSHLRAEENLILAEAQWRFAAGEQLSK